jgi:hypothetical protein
VSILIVDLFKEIKVTHQDSQGTASSFNTSNQGINICFKETAVGKSCKGIFRCHIMEITGQPFGVQDGKRLFE